MRRRDEAESSEFGISQKLKKEGRMGDCLERRALSKIQETESPRSLAVEPRLLQRPY